VVLRGLLPDDLDVGIVLGDGLAAIDAVDDRLDWRAVHQKDLALAAHLLEEIVAGLLTGLDGIGHDHSIRALGRRVDGDHDDACVLGAGDGRLNTCLIHGRDHDEIDALLDEGVDLGVLVCEIKLRVLRVHAGADLGSCLLRPLVHRGEEWIGHILHHQADLLDLLRRGGLRVRCRRPGQSEDGGRESRHGHKRAIGDFHFSFPPFVKVQPWLVW
jgi:hypothetical protein